MARRTAKGLGGEEQVLRGMSLYWGCQRQGGVAHHSSRRISGLARLVRYRVVVHRCQNPACVLYGQAVRPEEEGRLALPHGEFGLEVIALIGQLRFVEHRSLPEIHHALHGDRTVAPVRRVGDAPVAGRRAAAAAATGTTRAGVTVHVG